MATPTDLQNASSAIQWTNGQGLVTGAAVSGMFAIVIAILAGMGTWGSSGYTPNIASGSITALMLAPGAITTSQMPAFTGGDCTTSANSVVVSCAPFRAANNMWSGTNTFSSPIVASGGMNAGSSQIAGQYLIASGPSSSLQASDRNTSGAFNISRANGTTTLSDSAFGSVLSFSGTTGQTLLPASLSLGSPTPATTSAGELAIAKTTASGTAPGAGALKLAVVAGTNSGTCKIIAYAGTSTTPVTIVDNVGSGC